MQRDKLMPFEELYSASLKEINGIKFTSREIEVMACLLSARGAGKAADLLSISQNTVFSHTRTIMAKLGCNSREGILDFLEKSDKIPFLRRYYLSLTFESLFQNGLKKISKINEARTTQTLILYCENSSLEDDFKNRLEKHLALAGIKARIKIRRSFSREAEKAQHSPAVRMINLSKAKDYYLSVLMILKDLFPDKNIESHFKDFIENYKESQGSSPETLPKSPQDNRIISKEKNNLQKRHIYIYYISIIIVILFLCLSYIVWIHNRPQGLSFKEISYRGAEQNSFVTSDMFLPVDLVLIPRQQEMRNLDKKFQEGEKNIKIVAIMGPGGAGKTTLARQYAREQKASVLWELNGETRKSLGSSFEELANQLSTSEQESKILRENLDIKDIDKREEKIIEFVSGKLKENPGWFLIFDNIEDMAEVQKYLPHSVEMWGHGRVLLTSRDNTLQNNQSLTSIYQIEELTQDQKLDLFTRITVNKSSNLISTSQLIEARAFLEKIPSFPLDVSLAAYYLKITNASYKAYVDNLMNNNNEFLKIQETLLKEAGNYLKTRYAIVSLSLQQVIQKNKDFRDLLLFISLLDSQKIPRKIIDNFKGSLVVDKLMYYLNKYSLITNSSLLSRDKTISIHRSTQEIALKYFESMIPLKNKKSITKPMKDSLNNYTEALLEKEDFESIKGLIPHYEKFLSHEDWLTKGEKEFLGATLGEMYFIVGDYTNARRTLEKSLTLLDKKSPESLHKFARSLVFLANIERELGNYDKAIKLLEKSLEVYKDNLSGNPAATAFALGSLGNIYRSSGENEKAKDCLEKALSLYRRSSPGNQMNLALVLGYLGTVEMELGHNEKGKDLLEECLAIYKHQLSDDHVKIGWAAGNLAKVYLELADYKRARTLLEQTLLIYKKNFPENHDKIGWALAHLGSVYGELGEHAKARDMLEKSLEIHKKCFKENHPKIGWISSDLAKVYLHSGEYEKAKELLRDALAIYKEAFSEKHVYTAGVLHSLGRAYLLTNDFLTAEEILKKAFDIYSKENYVDIYLPLESLAELYLKRAEKSEKDGRPQEKTDLKNKAVEYLNSALKEVRKGFPKDSPHIKRIEEKLKSFAL